MVDSTDTEDSQQNHRPSTPPTIITNGSPTVEALIPTGNDSSESISATKSSKMAEDGSAAPAPMEYIDMSKSPRMRNLHQIEGLEKKFELGYDSDGEAGPFCRLEDIEGEQIFDEDDLPEKTQDEEGTVVTMETVDDEKELSGTHHVPIDDEALRKMNRE